MIDLDDYTESKNIMIYADTGAGKTTLAASLPGKVLIISSENGTIVIKRQLRNMFGEERGAKEAKRFKMWVVRSWQDLEDAFIWLRDNPGVFDWVVIDSATSVQQRAMRAAMEKAVARNPEKRDIDLPDKGEHQKMQNAMKRMITDFNELPVNVLWFAQAMHRENKDGDEIVLPFIMGKDYEVSAWACAQMQAFGYYRKVPRKLDDKSTVTARELMFDSFVDGKSEVEYWAKDRYGVLPRKATIAIGTEQKGTLGQLLALIESDVNAVARAKKRVEEYDDTADLDETPDDFEAAAQGGSVVDELMPDDGIDPGDDVLDETDATPDDDDEMSQFDEPDEPQPAKKAPAKKAAAKAPVRMGGMRIVGKKTAASPPSKVAAKKVSRFRPADED
jgi:hypothetical protein